MGKKFLRGDPKQSDGMQGGGMGVFNASTIVL